MRNLLDLKFVQVKHVLPWKFFGVMRDTYMYIHVRTVHVLGFWLVVWRSAMVTWVCAFELVFSVAVSSSF